MQKRCKNTTKHPKGFTLIELMFAMAAFSVMLVIAVSGLLNAMTIYNQANVSRDNQQQVRAIVEGLTRNIRAASVARVLSDGSLCLEGTPDGDVRYYQALVAGGPAKHLMRTNITNATRCSVLTPADLSYDTTTTKDLMSGGKSTDVSVFWPRQLQQVDGAGNPAAPSVRITLGIERGAGAASVRQRQFSNQFKLTSTAMVGVQ